jgi:hypothetical protein
MTDSTKANRGLTNWEKTSDSKILKTDVAVAENYLNKEKLEALGRIAVRNPSMFVSSRPTSYRMSG